MTRDVKSRLVVTLWPSFDGEMIAVDVVLFVKGSFGSILRLQLAES